MGEKAAVGPPAHRVRRDAAQGGDFAYAEAHNAFKLARFASGSEGILPQRSKVPPGDYLLRRTPKVLAANCTDLRTASASLASSSRSAMAS